MRAMRAFAAAALCCLGSVAISAPLSEARAALYLEFARSVSGNDPAINTTAMAFVIAPPTTLETIGFYGLEGASDDERALRGIISALADAGYLFEFDIQYLLLEFLEALDLSGVLGDDHQVPDLLDAIPAGDWDDVEFQREAMFALAAAVAPFARALEAEIQAEGREMLQLNVPFGDSVYYLFLPPEEAERWRCVVLWAGADVTRPGRDAVIDITAPDWALFYDLISIEPNGSGAVPIEKMNLPVRHCAAPQV